MKILWVFIFPLLISCASKSIDPISEIQSIEKSRSRWNNWKSSHSNSYVFQFSRYDLEAEVIVQGGEVVGKSYCKNIPGKGILEWTEKDRFSENGAPDSIEQFYNICENEVVKDSHPGWMTPELQFESNGILTSCRRQPPPNLADVPSIRWAISNIQPFSSFKTKNTLCRLEWSLIPLSSIQFARAGVEPSPGINENLRRVAKWFAQTKSDYILVVQGHADRLEKKDVSLRRANAVKSLLFKYGIPANRVKIVDFGDSRPLSFDELKKNRRVALVIEQ